MDSRFEPDVFLVEVVVQDDGSCQPAYTEPQYDHWFATNDIDHLPESIKDVREGYSDDERYNTYGDAGWPLNERLEKRSIRDAVLLAVNAHASKPSGMTYYCSEPSVYYAHRICAVIGIQTDISDEYHSLRHAIVTSHRPIPVATSFIEAAALEFLRYAIDSLNVEDPNTLRPIATDAYLREAAQRMLRGIVFRIGTENIFGMHNLFDALNTISSLRYEQLEGSGGIILAKKDHFAIDTNVKFITPVSLGNPRNARKVLEIATNEVLLYSDSEHLFGLATISDYSGESEDLFIIRQVGHHHWELCHGFHILMTVHYGAPNLPKPPFDVDKLRLDLPRIFSGITGDHIDNAVALVKAAEQQLHGTTLIFTQDAAAEASRLSKQSTPVSPLSVSTPTLKQLTQIDGALLLSPTGMCYGIGTILDGVAIDEGDPGRGARYNSALRYVAMKNKHSLTCLAVVVSEDGGVDFIPNLRPSIPRTLVDQRIAVLDFESKQESISVIRYRNAMEWLSKHQFYLLDEDCETINALFPLIEQRLREEQDEYTDYSYKVFAKHPVMDTSTYYQ